MGRNVNPQRQSGSGMIERRAAALIEFRFGEFTLDEARRSLSRNGTDVPIGSRAFDLLVALLRNAGRTVSKGELFEAAWPGSAVEESNLRVHIAAIRRAIGQDSAALQNEPGRGYRFNLPVSVRDATGSNEDEAAPQLNGEEIFGRDAAIEELVALLPLRRFITLVGPGGVGKTTVARLVAARLVASYRNGHLLLDFGIAKNGADLMQMLASALAIKVPEQQVGETVLSELAARKILLVFDNCEHVIEAATELAESIRGRAPNVHLLATSREPMRAHGEWLYPVAALPCPPPDAKPTLRAVTAYPAARLFAARLAAAGYRPSLSDEDAVNVAAIVRGLDGIPLAIELAAANAELLSIAELAEKLDDRLSLLRTGRRRGDKRHRTLEAMIDWSYRRLTDEQGRAWCWLGVFAGEFALTDACALLAHSGVEEQLCAPMFLDLVSQSLVDRSVERGSGTFRLLESLRIFALRQLVKRGELHAARRAHAQFLLDQIRGRSDRWDRADLMNLRVDRTLAELRLAIDWALMEGNAPDLGFDLSVESAPLWFKRLLLSELEGYLELARSAGITPSDRQLARLELALAHARFHARGVNSSVEDGLLLSAEAAVRASDLGVARQALWALFGHASVAGDYAAVAEYTRRYEAITPTGSDPLSQATAYRMRSLAEHLNGHQERALQAASEGLRNLSFLPQDSSTRVFQYDHRLATLAHRAKTYWLMGRPEEALADCDTILETARQIDQPFGLGHALASAACPVAIWNGEFEMAEVYVGTLVDLASGISNVWRSAGLVYRYALDRMAGRQATLPRQALTPFYCDVLATFSSEFLDAGTWERTQALPDHWCTAEIHRARGEQLWAAGDAQATKEAAKHIQYALVLAERQGARAWAHRARLSLAKLSAT